MEYAKLCEIYEKLENTKKGLEKIKIISEFLSKIKKEVETIYLLRGKIFADYETNEIGISNQILIKAISKSSGNSEEEIISSYRKTGDLGITCQELFSNKKQSSLFSSELTTQKILNNLRKITEIEGKGTIDKKIGLISEILNSASGKEAKYIIRTIVQDMKIGVGDGILREAISDYFFSPKDIQEKKLFADKIQEAYDKCTDFAEVFEKASKDELEKINITPGKPLKVMLFPKAQNIENAFEIVGKPAAFEYKYDGFRMLINKEDNEKIRIFTRRLEEVTNQFPDVLEYIKNHVSAKSFILDCEAVGFDPNTKEFRPFQYISQRIKRKYDVEKIIKDVPVELKIFDLVFLNGKSLIKEKFKDRLNELKKIVKVEKNKISLAEQIITDDEKIAEKFYEDALKDKQEGLMVKNLEAPYKPGARIGYAVKLKPQDDEIDLVITGAEWGTGKRAGWLTSFDVSCKDEETEELLEIGKVSSGLKEKKEEGFSYEELTELLKPLVKKEEGVKVYVKPKIIVSIKYQNIQKSPTYSSGFALRFPRIIFYRPDRSIEDICSLRELEKIVNQKL